MPAQLALEVGPPGGDVAVAGWSALPDTARREVLVLLARMIARDLLAPEAS